MESVGEIVELKKAYEVNSAYMKKRDEEFEKMKLELAACKIQLATVKMERKDSKRNIENEQKLELENLLQSTRNELEEAVTWRKEKSEEIKSIEGLNCKLITELCHAKEKMQEHVTQIAELQQLLRKTQNQLEKSQEECREKSDHIAMMEDLSLDYHHEIEIESDEDSDDDIFTGSISQSEFKRSLSPIPEENIDDITDYYDACRSYSESLKISIGSDLKIFDERSETYLIKHGAKAFNGNVQEKSEKPVAKIQSSVSAASVNSGKKNCKCSVNIKKRRFKKLFSFGISNSTL